MSVDHSKMFAKGDVYINGIEGFWSFAKENMAKYHGVSSDKFLLYIKEMDAVIGVLLWSEAKI